jgi:hypothetical protein
MVRWCKLKPVFGAHGFREERGERRVRVNEKTPGFRPPWMVSAIGIEIQ